MSGLLDASFQSQVAPKGKLGVYLSEPQQMETSQESGSPSATQPSVSPSTSSPSPTTSQMASQLDMTGLVLGALAAAAAIVFFIKR